LKAQDKIGSFPYSKVFAISYHLYNTIYAAVLCSFSSNNYLPCCTVAYSCKLTRVVHTLYDAAL